jgi:hypothetical protein
MSSTDHNKPSGKPGQRKAKPKQQGKKPDQRQRAKPDQPSDRRRDEKELIETAGAPTETFLAESQACLAESQASTDAAAIEPEVASTGSPSKGALVPIAASPVALADPFDTFMIGVQTIANAYRAYTLRSFEETLSFVEKLSAARSLDKTVEIQSEFAKQSCETFLADSQKIWRLYSELARRFFKPLERFAMRTQTAH